jgi:radical SAM enzyme (TIGR01210 family)
MIEYELAADGSLASTAVVFLTNKRCPFRCVMCDLWRHTVDERVAVGEIPRQLGAALAALPPARQVKLYNAGSFFDPGAIPPEDDEQIAALVAGFDRVIVEAHPAFLTGSHGERCRRLRDRLRGRLEVAIGLETANEDVLARLDKHMTVDAFRQAAGFLAANDIDLRAFILLKPPFMAAGTEVEWARRSIDVARDCGATACSIIPTRAGNDGMPADFTPPRLPALERAVEYGFEGNNDGRRGGRGAGSAASCRTFADLWDVERFYDCGCSPARAARLAEMNRTQQTPPRVECRCAA